MKTLRCACSGVKKFCGSACFLVCVLGTAVACLFTVVSEDTYTVLSLMLSTSRDELAELALDAATVFSATPGEAVTMLAPVLAAAPVAIPLAMERRSGYLRSVLLRCGRVRYCAANLLAALFTGGAVFALGRLLYGGVVLLFFPVVEPVAWSGVVMVLRRLLGMFLYGCGSGLAAFALTFCTGNFYLTLCIPFLLNYVAPSALEWLGARLFDVYSNPLVALEPRYLQGAASLTQTGLLSLGCYLALSLLVLGLGVLVMERRADCGS